MGAPSKKLEWEESCKIRSTKHISPSTLDILVYMEGVQEWFLQWGVGGGGGGSKAATG
jgi:hypothetical protein